MSFLTRSVIFASFFFPVTLLAVVPAAPPGTTATTTSEMSSPGLAILDNATISDTISFSSGDSFIWDVDLILDVTHTFASDLEITLTSPAGTVAVITTDNGGGNDDVFSGTVFDDDAVDSGGDRTVNDFSYTNGVTATPLVIEDALGTFYGEDPNGDWTIEVADDAGGDTGTLNGWSLDITTLNPAAETSTMVSGTVTPNAPISDNTSTVTRLDITEDAFICGIELYTEITHTFASDLEISLTSPGGTTVTISTDNGGGADDVFDGTTWSDQAEDPATDHTYSNLVTATPLTPEGAMSAFSGESSQGLWVLDVFDDAGGDTGTLVEWGLEIESCAGAATDAITRFEVLKDFSDDNTASVDVEISCNTGLPISQPSTIEEGDPVTFVVTDFNDGELNCTITETEVDGYTASYDNGDGMGTSAESCVFTGVTFESVNTCTITNELEPVTVTVTKWWMDENPISNGQFNFASADYSCANTASGNPTGSLDFLGDGASGSFDVFPRWDGITTCTISETVVDNGVEFDDSECFALSVTVGNDASCNLYNTRLYEGIPTLSQYGLALMALMMLGVGLIGFRRYV